MDQESTIMDQLSVSRKDPVPSRQPCAWRDPFHQTRPSPQVAWTTAALLLLLLSALTAASLTVLTGNDGAIRTVFESMHGPPQEQRRLSGGGGGRDDTTPTKLRYPTYHTVPMNELGALNPDAAIGNPLRGLLPSPDFRSPMEANETGVPHSLEFYYIGWNSVFTNDYTTVNGNINMTQACDWSYVERLFTASAARHCHAVLRFYIHYLGRPLEIPPFLLPRIPLEYFVEWGNNEVSPNYDDYLLQDIMASFIAEFGRNYDGDKRIAFVQAGLLGFWGEWHTFGRDYLSESVKDLAVTWFAKAFVQTKVQIRYPRRSAYDAGFGFHDDSFAYETLDGAANGGFDRAWYFWNRFVNEQTDDFWKHAPLGGETRVEVQHEIFEPDYPARTFQKQDFMECVNVTHATYMLHQTYVCLECWCGCLDSSLSCLPADLQLALPQP
jgi:hypothetical protein